MTCLHFTSKDYKWFISLFILQLLIHKQLMFSPLLWRDEPVLHSQLNSGQIWRPAAQMQRISGNRVSQRKNVNNYGGERHFPTSSTLHAATWLAWMPWTPGSSLQCCSQHKDRVRSDWLLKADMNSDGYTPCEDMSVHRNIQTHDETHDCTNMQIWGEYEIHELTACLLQPLPVFILYLESYKDNMIVKLS